MKPVSELLKRHDGTLWHIDPQATVFEALQTLARLEVGALMVMQGGKLVGIFSERDYTRKIALQGRSSKDTQVADIMTRNVFTVSPSTGTRACMALMSEKKIRHLPIVMAGTAGTEGGAGDTVMGMISIRDIMDDIIADHEATIAQLETYIQS
jgi:CBS domain-containing protein